MSIKVEKRDFWGFRHAIRGMRNPLESHDKSDTKYDYVDGEPNKIGENDLALMQKLYRAGTEHRKYMRQIMVSMDITAPLYWWKEFDTYKIGTVANSCSTMHRIHAKEFTLDDFSHEHLFTEESYKVLKTVIDALNEYRESYQKTKRKEWWWQMIQLLPSSYNQKRTVTMNYENAVTIIRQRTGHKLDEWNVFVDELRELPFLEDICRENDNV